MQCNGMEWEWTAMEWNGTPSGCVSIYAIHTLNVEWNGVYNVDCGGG